ncbi:MAG: hypothetical protein WA919_12460 [Coleofasciculaceae cyanobacterium]
MAVLANNQQEVQKVLSQVIAKTWLDEEFKQHFVANPAAVLNENGLSVPSGVEFKLEGNTLVGTNSGEVVYELPLSDKPAGLTDQAIQSWANGNSEYIGSDCIDNGSCFATF